MSIFQKSKKEDELVLVFNIGSSSVGGAFFKAQMSGVPKIVFSTEEQIPLEGKIDIDRLLFLTIQTLETIVERAYRSGVGVPKRVFCILSSPWYVSQIRTINLEKNAPFVFTSKLANSLMEKEMNFFKEEYVKKNGDGRESSRIIELKNVKTLLNGYETAEPLGQKAKELEMTIFVSMGGEEILNKIEETIKKYFNVGAIRFSSFAMSSFAVVRGMYPRENNFLLVDVGGEVSDIFMVKNGALCESMTFPLGCSFFTRGVASMLPATLDEANSLFSLLKDGHAERKLAQKLTSATSRLKTEWLKHFGESLSRLSGGVSIPSVVYLSTDRGMFDFFAETIEKESFNQYSYAESKFKIIPLNTQNLHGVVVFKDDVPRQPSLIINSIYINRFLIKTP